VNHALQQKAKHEKFIGEKKIYNARENLVKKKQVRREAVAKPCVIGMKQIDSLKPKVKSVKKRVGEVIIELTHLRKSFKPVLTIVVRTR